MALYNTQKNKEKDLWTDTSITTDKICSMLCCIHHIEEIYVYVEFIR